MRRSIMPLQDDHQIVSVDDHLVEHPRVWQDRLPKKYLEQGPRIVDENGMHLWHYDGQVFPTIGLNAVAGKPPEEWGMDPVRYEDMIPGCYEPVSRVADMDLDGVQSALCFPSFPGFGGGTFQRADDKDLALLCVKAWNDFYIDEWCAVAPERYVPLAILPTWDIDACVAEAERVAAKGARTISFPDSPVPLGLPSFHSDHWDGLWRGGSGAQKPGALALRVRSLLAGLLVFHDQAGPGSDGGARRTLRGRDGTVLHEPDVVHGRPAVLRQAAAVPGSPDLARRGRHRLGALHPGANGLRVGAPSLLPEDRFRHPSVGSVPQALLGLFHRRRARPEESAQHRHRPDHARDRLPAQRFELAELAQARRRGPRRRARR